MWSNAKIMRMAECALRRTEAYRENRICSDDPKDNYELDYVLMKSSGSAPDTVTAFAHWRDEIITFDPLEFDGSVRNIGDWSFGFDSDLFRYLEQGYELAGMSLTAHYACWMEIQELHHDGCITYLKGMQRYLRYCKQNGVTSDLLRQERQYSGVDVMALYDKPMV